MHKKFHAHLQNYLNELTAADESSPESESQSSATLNSEESHPVSANEPQLATPQAHPVKPRKKSLSLPTFTSGTTKNDIGNSNHSLDSSNVNNHSNANLNTNSNTVDGVGSAADQDSDINTFDPIENPTPRTRSAASSRPRRLKKRWLLGGTLVVAIAATVLALPKVVDMVEQWRQTEQIKTYEAEQDQDSEVLRLALLPPAERDAKLQAIANQPQVSLERSRARYLLAGDLLTKYEGGPAVRMLENLEVDYPILGPYVLLMRGRGYQLSNEKIKAQETWLEILEKYPDSPVVVNALANLGTLDESYWQRAIAEHPTHPRTLDILHQKLEKNPNSLEIQRQILQANPTDNRAGSIVDQLLKNTADLTPEDWQAIGDNFWHRRMYNQAIAPYEKAPKNPQNLYRLARSQQLSDLKDKAKANYQTLIQTYPDATETATALKRLAGLVPPAEGVKYLQQLAQKFPEQGAEALEQEIELLRQFDQGAAQQAQQRLLEQYSDSDAAANYRWRQAKEFAKAGNFTAAWQWARDIAAQNPQSDVTPKAVFWIGKWAQKLGRPDDAKAAFENVLARYPQSYYAWRSAVLLGWPVGDFNSVRFLNPPVTVPAQRPIPPAGSATFKELYRLAQDPAAIELFAAELQAQKDGQNPPELTVNEGFTEALLKLSQQEYLQGINQILNLRDPDDPEQRKAWEALRATPDYWQALFPFPYQKLIFEWSQKRQLNPFLVTALIRQESRFEKDIKSPVGATGLMQVMPSTAEWIAPQIGLKDYSLTDPTDNINMGTWYFDHTHQTYNNNSALAVASYNAGPGNVSKWLAEFNSADPDEFVEKIPFRETKGYVESVFGNYWNYLRIYDPDVQQLMTRVPNPN